MSDLSDCTFETCTIEDSIFQYRPSLVGNAIIIALFGISLFIHAFQGVKLRQWTFSILMVLGCVSEMVGYGARVKLYNDPWDFNGFLMQIITITFAPVFMTAAIYITLYKSVLALSPSSAAFKPALYYQIFIPCDFISLALQAAGGAMSTSSNGSSQTGVDVALAGLSFQVITLTLFVGLAVQYAFRYRRDSTSENVVVQQQLNGRWKLFLSMLSLASLVIFVRCVYRIYELNEGYSGKAIHDQPMFIGLESCMILIATFALNIGHPGLVIDSHKSQSLDVEQKQVASSSDES